MKRKIQNWLKPKHQTPECIANALRDAEWVMNNYTPEEIEKYRTTFNKKLERIIMEDVERLEMELNSLKKLKEQKL